MAQSSLALLTFSPNAPVERAGGLVGSLWNRVAVACRFAPVLEQLLKGRQALLLEVDALKAEHVGVGPGQRVGDVEVRRGGADKVQQRRSEPAKLSDFARTRLAFASDEQNHRPRKERLASQSRTPMILISVGW